MNQTDDDESAWCQANYRDASIVGVIYRPPSSPESFLENFQFC